MNDLTHAGGAQLPALPIPSLFPLSSLNLREQNLILDRGFQTAEQCIAAVRASINPAKSQMRRVYTMEPASGGKTVTVKYWLDFTGRKKVAVGRTINDEDAVRILIGNSMAGAWMSSITWELYKGRTRDDLVDMERIDQWGLLSAIEVDKLLFLQGKGIQPQGNWDFYGLLEHRQCSVCGTPVAINMHAYNIDSGVCSTCGNRPWLAPSLHNFLDSAEDCPSRYMRTSAHALRWMAGVGARFGEVRRDKNDPDGQRLRQIWQGSIMARALNPATEGQVEIMLERSATCHITMFREMCRRLEEVFLGRRPFTKEHLLVAQFVFGMIELMQAKQLSTKDE